MNKQTAPSYDGRFYSLRAQPVMHHQEMEEDDDDDDCVAAANGRAHTHTHSAAELGGETSNRQRELRAL